MSEFAFLPVAVIGLVIKDSKILLLKRKNTDWMNWYWWLPGGRLDKGESMTAWAIRELREEIWIEVRASEILSKNLIHHKDERWERLYFIILADNFTGTPTNREEEKSEWIEWFDLSNLPLNVTPQVAICLDAIQNKKSFSEYWYSDSV